MVAGLVLGGLAVVGVIVLAIAIGGVRHGVSLRGGDSCRSNLKQIGLGMLMFAQDYNETFPDSATWREQIQPYIRDPQILECPGRGPGSYEMNPSLSEVSLSQIMRPGETPLVYDAGFPNGDPPHPEGWNVTFADGHCKAISKTEAVQYRQQGA